MSVLIGLDLSGSIQAATLDGVVSRELANLEQKVCAQAQIQHRPGKSNTIFYRRILFSDRILMDHEWMLGSRISRARLEFGGSTLLYRSVEVGLDELVPWVLASRGGGIFGLYTDGLDSPPYDRGGRKAGSLGAAKRAFQVAMREFCPGYKFGNPQWEDSRLIVLWHCVGARADPNVPKNIGLPPHWIKRVGATPEGVEEVMNRNASTAIAFAHTGRAIVK